MIDWLYLGFAALSVVIVMYICHLVVVDFEIFGLFGRCIKLIETYFWTSLFFVIFMAAIVYDLIQKQKRHYGHYRFDRNITYQPERRVIN